MTDRATGKIAMSRLARIDSRLAELSTERAELEAKRAQIFAELANDSAPDIRTGRRNPKAPEPQLPEISEFDRSRAERALQRGAARRRLGT